MICIGLFRFPHGSIQVPGDETNGTLFQSLSKIIVLVSLITVVMTHWCGQQ
jgi:hypothetical protein